MNSSQLVDEYRKANAVEYAGYSILDGSVYSGGECLLIAFCPLDPTESVKAELLANAKQWIDELKEAA